MEFDKRTSYEFDGALLENLYLLLPVGCANKCLNSRLKDFFPGVVIFLLGIYDGFGRSLACRLNSFQGLAILDFVRR